MRRYLQNLAQVLYLPRGRVQKAHSNDPYKRLLPIQLQSTPPARCLKSGDKNLEDRGQPKNSAHRSTFDRLFNTTLRSTYRPNNKITVFGTGDIGMATVFSLLTKGVTNDISMIDFNENILKAELMDLQSGSKFLPNAKIRASKDFAISSESKICVLTPCAPTQSDDGKCNDVGTNAEVLKLVVPQLLKYSPDTIILVAIDPVDVLTYLTWTVSGLPRGRVLGSGTNLASATFRFLLADRMGLAPSSCSGYIIGENGKSCVPVWSSVAVAGVPLLELNPDVGTETDAENWRDIHRQVMLAGQAVRDFKGSNTWAAALSIADICAAIVNDTNSLKPVSTYVKGEHNIEEDVFLSLPCVVGSAGVTDVIRQPLTPAEMELLHKSAEAVARNQGRMKITC